MTFWSSFSRESLQVSENKGGKQICPKIMPKSLEANQFSLKIDMIIFVSAQDTMLSIEEPKLLIAMENWFPRVPHLK